MIKQILLQKIREIENNQKGEINIKNQNLIQSLLTKCIKLNNKKKTNREPQFGTHYLNVFKIKNISF